MKNLFITILLATMVIVGYFFHQHGRSSEQTTTFKGYLLQNKPDIFSTTMPRDYHTKALIYKLIIDDIITSFTIFDPAKTTDGIQFYKAFSKVTDLAKCANAPQTEQFKHYIRPSFDLLRGQCVVAHTSKTNKATIVFETKKRFTFRDIKTGKIMGAAGKDPNLKSLRALIGRRAEFTTKSVSALRTDDFTDQRFIKALKAGPTGRSAVVAVLDRRFRYQGRSGFELKPEISKPVSMRLANAVLASQSKNTALSIRTLFVLSSEKSAATIYSLMIKRLYQSKSPKGPKDFFYYGSYWRKQVREKHPELEQVFLEAKTVPQFAVSHSFDLAAATALKFGQPYISLFYEEFETELMSQVIRNTGPRVGAQILRLEADVPAIIARIRAHYKRAIPPVMLKKIEMLQAKP